MASRTLFLLCALLGVAQHAHGQETLLCVAEKSTGFKWVDGQWRIANFLVDGEDKLIIKPKKEQSRPQEGLEYEIVPLGSDYVLASCYREKQDSGEFTLQVGCGTLQYVVNFKTLRYQHYYVGHYVIAYDIEKSDTPSLTIGKCVKM